MSHAFGYKKVVLKKNESKEKLDILYIVYVPMFKRELTGEIMKFESTLRNIMGESDPSGIELFLKVYKRHQPPAPLFGITS
jgi:hypothetical protein